MTKRARRALEASIEHWVDQLCMLILDYLSGESLWEEIEIQGIDCPLCGLYQTGRTSCWRCPVYARTGLELCKGTPYGAVHRWLSEVMKAGRLPDGDRDYAYREGYRLIVAEIKFLESLREGV